MEHIERVQRELKYKGAILSMYADTIKVPNGNTAVWDFIGHQGAAAVVPVRAFRTTDFNCYGNCLL